MPLPFLFLVNWRTTIAGAIPFGVAVAQAAGLVIPGLPHLDLAATLGPLLLGFLAKDSNK